MVGRVTAFSWIGENSGLKKLLFRVCSIRISCAFSVQKTQAGDSRDLACVQLMLLVKGGAIAGL